MSTASIPAAHPAGERTSAPLYPPRVRPPEKRLGRVAFMARFLANPIAAVPAEVYEQDVVARENGRAPVVWVTEPGMVKAVLLDQKDAFNKELQIKLLSPLLGSGILTSEGADWKWQRQASAPMFRQSELLSLVPAIVKASEDGVARWRKAGSGALHAIDREMTQVTFDVISATLLPSADDTVGPAVERNAGQFQQGTAWSLLYNVMRVPKWLPHPGRAAMQRSRNSLREQTGRLIDERRAEGGRKDDLMQRLMEAKDPETGKEMSREKLIDNLLTFYLAGHETTAKALTWTLFLLARAPEWHDRLAEEVVRVVGGGPVEGQHIAKLVLTEQVLKEAMRLYPPAPQMSRVAEKDVDLGGGHVIRKGSQVVIPIYAIQRHKKRWEDPDRFDPMRFAPEKDAKISRYQYMPFGAGPRICIGMAFAMIEAVAILATIVRGVRRFEAAPELAPQPIARVTLIPKGGMPLTVWPREAA
jgi:cytochrome P450